MKTWAEVAESPEFGNLSATEQAAAREQYFRDAVAPQVPRDELAAVRRQFDADPDTRLRKQPLNPKVKPSPEGAGRGRQGGPDPDTMPPMDRFRLSLADARTPIQPRDQSERRGGVRREISPFVAGGGDAGAGRGLVNPPTVGAEAPDYTARGPAGALADVRANTAARNERLAPPPTAGQLLKQPAPADQRVPGLSDVEMAQGSIAPDRLAAMRAQAEYLNTSRSPSARPLNLAQDLTASLRDATTNPVVRGAVSGFAQLGQVGVGAVRAGAEAVGADGLAERARGASAAASTVAQDATRDLKGSDKLMADVTSSIINSVPAVAMGVVGGPAMRTLFAQSAAADYAETGNAAHAGIQAAAEVLGERFGFAEQVKLLKGVVRGMPTNEVAKVFGALITKEIPGEQLTTALQFLGDKFGPGARNPNATMADYLQQAGDTLAVTIGQTAVMGGGPAVLSTTRNAMAAGDQAIDRSARTMAERAAMDAGFAPPAPQPAAGPPALQPTELQRDVLARFDNFAAVNGLPGKVAAAVKKAAAEMPLADAAGFMKRAVQALAKRGLYRGPLDDAALTVLDQPATPAAQAAQAAPEQEPAPAPAPVDTEADYTGLDTPSVAPAAAPVAGEPINRNWTAYSPESGTLGIPRADMPQIKAEHRGALVNFMKGRGITHEAEEVDPTSLKPTQAEFSPKKVQGAREFTGGDRAVLVSADGYVLDGHHQWQAKLDGGQPVKVLRLNAPIQDLLRLAHQFPSSTTAGGPRRTNDVAVPDVPAPAGVAPGAADGGGDQSPRGGGDLGLPAAGADRSGDPAAAPERSGGTPGPVGDGRRSDQALTQRVIGSYGKTPKGATEIELRPNADGSLTPYTGKYAMLDFNSGEPIVLAADTTDAAAIEQIRASGAIGKKDKVFGVKKDEPATATAAPAPSAAAPAESPGGALRSVAPDTKQPDAAAPNDEPNAPDAPKAESDQAATPAAAPAAPAPAADVPGAGTAGVETPGLMEHVTKKGKTIRGVVRKDMTGAEAMAIDVATFKKDGGYFIREKHLAKLAEFDAKRSAAAAPADAPASTTKPRLAESADGLFAKLKSLAGGHVSAASGRGILPVYARNPAGGPMYAVEANGKVSVIGNGGMIRRDATAKESDEFHSDLEGDRLWVQAYSRWGGSGGERVTSAKPVEELHSPSGLDWQGKTSKSAAPSVADQARAAITRATEARRVERETERTLFRDLLANPEIVGMSLKKVEVLVAAKAGNAIKPEKAALLARAIHKEAAKRAAELQKSKHRDPGVRAAAVAEAVASSLPDAGDASAVRQAAVIAGFDHALKGKTKSTLAGEHLADMLQGYEAAQRWIETEEGAAWFEGRPLNKLENTGVDLRRWYEQLRAQMKADEPDMKKAWKQIERATARSDLFAPLLPEGVTPGYRTYIVELRDMVQPFKAWLENAYRWDGEAYSRSRYARNSKSNSDLMLEGLRYPSTYQVGREVSRQEADAFQDDEAFRANWLRARADEYIQKVRDLLEVVEGTSSVQEAATNWHERFVKKYSDRRWNVSAENLTDNGKALISSRAGGNLWNGGEVSTVLNFSHESEWSKNLIANETTIALPDKATPLTPPRLDRVTRNGPNLRNGNDVAPKDFEAMFGLASVGFGKWVAAKQDQDHLNYAYDAFADLARHFGAPIDAIGFGKQLHFTVGALGHGKFAAHFQPKQPSPIGAVPVINLTNTKGDGTVYHEWIHALDHFLGGQWRNGMVRERVLSYLKQGVLTPERVEKVAERFLVGGSYWKSNKRWSKVEAAVHAMNRPDVLYKATAYKTNADALGKDYWGNDEELLARAGEAWAADTLGHTNTYLVNPDWVGDGKVTQGANYRGTPYPSGAERQQFNQVLTALAKAIKWANGQPSVTMGDFMAALPEEFKAGEARRMELKDKAAMEALLAKIQARRADEEASRAADAAERARREQQELDDLAEQKVKGLPTATPTPPAPPIVDTPQPSATTGPLSDDDLSALFDEAAAELRESQQEEPNTPPPGEVDRERWTQANLDEMLAAQDQAGASGIATAIKLPGIPTIHELGELGSTSHLGFGMFQTTGRAPGKDARTLGDEWRLTWDGGGAMRQTSSGKSYTLVQVSGPRPFTISLQEAMAAVAPARWAAPRTDRYDSPPRDPGSMTPMERDRAAAGRLPASAPAPAPAVATDPKAAQLIAQAAALGVKGADEALIGLAKLFGGPGRLNSFPAGFDEETYQKAKPHFQAALVSFQDAGKTLKDLFKLLIQQFGDGIKEYAIRFAKDQELTAQLGGGASASSAMAEWVKSRLAVGHAFDWRLLFMKGDEFFGGTQAEGKYTPKDAYDAMEAGMNRYILSRPDLFSPAVGREDAMLAVAALTRVTNLLPTQTKRTAEQDQFQQFSTVPPFAYLANWVANIQAGETMAEFSAGIGGLAVFAKNAGAKLVLNELSARRAAVLREVFPGARVFQENAEQIDNILPDDIVPSVVVINPPFSSSASTGAKNTTVGAQHVEQALERLAPGGRFVGIVGEGMQLDKPAFSAWWAKIRKEYHVRAVIPVDGSGYAKYGTTFNNALLVIDKIKPPKDAARPIVTPVTEYTDLIGLLAEVRDDRPAHNVPIDARDAMQPDPERGDGPASAAGAGSPAGGSPTVGGAADVGDRQPGGRSGVGGGGGSGGRAGRGQRPGGTGGQPGRPGLGDGTGPADGRAADAGLGGRPDPAGDATGVSIAGSQTAASGELTDSVFENYTPQRLQVPGAKPHPGALVQSAAMASVLPPAPTYTPNLPKESVEGGLLSIAQIEAIVYAGQAHGQLLDMTVQLSGKDPDAFAKANGLKGDTKYRRGFFIGDGTGVGKGREISGIMLDNLRQGRTRAVWVSEKQGLMADAKRDFAGVGGDAGIIFNQNKTSAGDKISAADGIVFTTYATLRSGSKDAEAGGFKKGAPVQVGRPFGRSFGGSGEGEDYDTAKLVKIDQKKSQVTVERNGKTSVHPFAQILAVDGDQSWINAIRNTGSTAQTRLDQLVKWLGPDFDGVIAFDEAHNAGNAVPMKGERGTSDPSAQALAVVELQRRLPNARVVYVSATGATEVSNLSFATRLGVWGPGTAFPNVDSFIAQMTAGGLATMELVARDMKQTGSYLARSLSFDGVSYSRVEHELTDLQRDIYDKLAEAWQVTLQNFMAALEATGVVSEETGKSKNGRALAAAKSAYWGAQQRFFNQIITSMQMPSVLESIERDLAAGDAVVLQLVNTNEAQQERALAKKKEEGESEELEDLDLTPRDQLIQMVQKSFPVQQYEDKFDDEGKRITVPVVDSEGKPVLNKRAVAMRDALIKDLQQIRVPDGPLELILNQFGPDITAEITGRKQRVVRKPNKDGEIAAQLEKRGDAAVRADAEAFMADKKRILVFSDAGGTGFSFHADLTKQNQRKRKHYLIQPGWRANKAVQGLGRSHRTNQASAPHYTLASTNIPAHKRFLSSIARRLDQLGALTKGQRDTSSGGLFSEKDNLESKYATQAVRRLIDDVRLGQVEGVAFDEFLRQLGLEDIVNADTQQIAEDKYPPTRQFLNRMLSLTLSMQEKVFNAFIARMEEQVDLAAARGELDTGMQTLRALRTRVVNQQVVHVDERTGAETSYVELELEHPTKMYPFPDPKKQGGNVEWLVNVKSDRVWGRVKSGTSTKKDGTVVDRYRMLGTGGTQIRDDKDFAPGAYKPIDKEEAEARWSRETASRPATYTEKAHMIVGAMLPIWDRLNVGTGILEVARTQTEDGERLLGRKVAPKDVADLLKRLDIAPSESTLDPAEVLARVLRGEVGELANGWKLKRSKVSDDLRVELIMTGGGAYAGSALTRELVTMGVIQERIQWNDRYFLPIDKPAVLAALTKNRPLIALSKPGGDAPALSRSDAAALEALARRLETLGRGVPVDALRNEVARIAASWDAKTVPAPMVVANAGELPAGIQASLRSMGAYNATRGLVMPSGQVYLIADALPDMAAAQMVLFHEVYGHIGLRAFLGKGADTQMGMLRLANPKLAAEANTWYGQFGEDQIAARVAAGMSKEEAGRVVRSLAVEEALADRAGQAEPPKGWKLVMASLQKALRRMGLDRVANWLESMTEAETHALLMAARQAVRGGRVHAFTRETAPALQRVYHGTPALVQAVADTQDDSTYNYVVFSGDDVSIQQALLSQAAPGAVGVPLLSQAPKHTPEQAKALAKAGTGGPPSARQKLRLYWGEAVDLVRNRGALGQTFRQGALDQFFGIQRAITRELGSLPVEQDPYVTARLANGGTSAVMRALMLHGQARWAANGQHLEKIPDTKGLLDILKPLGDDVNDWFGWMIGNRAARLMKEGRENNFTPADIKALQSLATPDKRVKFAQAALEYKAFKRSVLDLAQAAGLIDPAGRAAWDHADYIPFYRQFDEKALFSPTGRKGLAGQSSGIRTLKGGSSALNDPMENLLMNFSRLVDASLKNNAIRKTIDALADTEVVNKVGYDMTGVSVPAKEVARYLVEQGAPEDVLGTMPPEVFEGIARMWAIKPPADPDVVRVMEGGKPKFYRVSDPLLLKALTSFVPFDFPGLALMRGAKRLLTSLVTSTPEFMLRNWIRDSVAVQAIGRQGFNPAKSLSGIAKSYRESGGFESMLFAGASFQSGNVNAADPEATGRAMRRALRSRGLSAASAEAFMGTLIDTPAKLWEQYSKIGEAIENANREAVFEATSKAGGSVTAAAFEAKDLMDFSLRGSWPAYHLLADVLPFFNARVQGLYRLGRSDMKRLAAVGGLLMVASLLLGFANDGEDWYEELPDWDKDLYWHFRIGGQHFRLPKPFEIGVIFATIPERIGRSIKGLDGGKKTMDRLWANVRDQLAFDPVPQLIRPVMDVWANKDTFRDRPIENQADEGKAPHARFNAMTSATTRVITGVAAPVTDAIGLGPKKLEYLVNGYFGTVGMYALGLSDLAVRSLEGAPPGPAWRADDIPVVRAFYRVDPARSTVFETDLYKMNQEVDRLYREMRALQKDGKAQEAAQLVTENRTKLAVREKVNSGVQELTSLNRQRDKIITDRTMTPEQKRVALDDLQRKKNAIAKQVANNPTVRAALQ